MPRVQSTNNSLQTQHQAVFGVPLSLGERGYVAATPQEAEYGQNFGLAISAELRTFNSACAVGYKRKCHSKSMPAPKAGNWMKFYGNWNGFCRAVIRSTGRDLGGGVLKF
jgi:hypothetical protein